MEPFVYKPPEAEEIPLLVSIPHTGVYVPEEIADTLASDYIRSLPMTDWHLHHLYDFLPSMGIDVIHATYSRFVVDMNRPPEPKALYPGRFETGLVATKTFNGEDIYKQAPSEDEVKRRREKYHAPYHAELARVLEKKKKKFGHAFLIDAHSIASRPTLMHDTLQEHIYLGNRDGASCGPAFMDFMDERFQNHGLKVSRNKPYKGGYITDHYGSLDKVQALQIEMNQQVYMDEDDPPGALAHPRFAEARAILRDIFGELSEAIAAGRL